MSDSLADRACAGLDLPADVPEGAVKRLVEAAKRVETVTHGSMIEKGFPTAFKNLRAALRELGVKE